MDECERWRPLFRWFGTCVAVAYRSKLHPGIFTKRETLECLESIASSTRSTDATNWCIPIARVRIERGDDACGVIVAIDDSTIGYVVMDDW